MTGGWLKWRTQSLVIKLLQDGTGGLVLGDDLRNFEFKGLGGLLGGGAIWWTAGEEQSGLSSNRAALYYLTSEYEIGAGFEYFIEVGMRNEKYGELIGLKYQGVFAQWYISSRFQARHYDDEMGDKFVGNIEHMYVSYDQYDKRFTNAANLFVIDDNVNAYSAVMDNIALFKQYDFFGFEAAFRF